jgi:hypothetical protein
MNSSYNRTLSAAYNVSNEFEVTCEICDCYAELIRFKNKYVCHSCRDHIREACDSYWQKLVKSANFIFPDSFIMTYDACYRKRHKFFYFILKAWLRNLFVWIYTLINSTPTP